MKILMSGMTYAHGHGEMFFVKAPTMGSFIQKGLQLAGHDVSTQVSWDIIEAADPDAWLRNYDAVILGLSAPLSITCRLMYQAFDMHERCKALGIPVTWYTDDWRFGALKSHMGTLVRGYDRRTVGMGARRKGTTEYFMSVKEKVLAACGEFLAGACTNPVMLEMFNPDAPVDPIIRAKYCNNQIYQYDGTTQMPRFGDPTLLDKPKEERWVLAALDNYDKWVSSTGVRWPVLKVGKANGERSCIPENTVVEDMYATSWGVMIPTYPSYVGRLWRSRYVHAYMTGAFTLTTSKEVREYLGPAFAVDPCLFERQTPEERMQTIALQRGAFEEKTWTAEQFASSLDKFVRSMK
jgi:hypothetical protein